MVSLLCLALLALLVLLQHASTVAISSKEVKEDMVFDSESKMKEHVKALNQQASSTKKATSEDSKGFNLSLDDEEQTAEEKEELRREELRVRLSLRDVADEHGKMSAEYAAALHRLGRSLHKQRRFDDGFEVASEIVTIHEKIDGPEHLNTAHALSNAGSAAYRLNKKQEVEWAMNRALYILIKAHGEDAKEVLLHRGRMLTFHVPYAQTSTGISYEDYTYEL